MVYKVNVDEKISVYQETKWFVEAESEQQAIDKVVRWIKTDMENVGEDLVDIESGEMFFETTEHEEWIMESIECEGLLSENGDYCREEIQEQKREDKAEDCPYRISAWLAEEHLHWVDENE